MKRREFIKRGALFVPATFGILVKSRAASPIFFGQNGVSASAPADFDPTIYGLTTQGWWAARLESGLVDNDPIASLTDNSGNGRTVSQGTSSWRPTYKTGVSGVSLPVAYFDGGDYLQATYTQAQSFTIACVAKCSGGAVYEAIVAGSPNDAGVYGWNSGSAWATYAGSSFTYGTKSSWTVIVSVFNGASSFAYHNGTKVTGSPGATSISTLLLLGAGYGAGSKLTGYIGEAVIWSGAMSDANAAAACASIQSTWGL